jgi:hypothetical protein
MITKPFILAKDFNRIGVKILHGNKILRDHRRAGVTEVAAGVTED